MEQSKIKHEADMLEGNIARMVLTQDIKELESHYKYGKERLERIYKGKLQQLGGSTV